MARGWAERLRRRRRDENGVIAIVLALVTCFTVIPLAAIAVDIGVQRVARRDVQAVADLVALDLARQLDGRTYQQLQPQLQALADKSAARNAGGVGAPTVVAVLGRIDTTKYVSDPANYFTPTTAINEIPNAVKVTARTSVDFAIHEGEGGANRTAISTARASACYSIGSFALNLDSSKSTLLNGMINDALNLSVVSYTGLANANVSLLGLATELGAGSVDGLLNLDNLSLGDLYLASATALQKAGGETADITLLNQLATANIGALPDIAFADLIALEAGNSAALNSTVNLLDLVSGSAFLANGNNALAVPNLTVGVPSISSITTSLRVIQKPIMNCSSAPAQTSQIDLSIQGTVANLNLLVFQAVTTIDINLSVASGTATRTSVSCGNPVGVDVLVASGLASLHATPNVALKLLGITIANVTGSVGTNAPAANQTVQFRHPPDSYDVKKSVGSPAALPTLSSSNLSVQLVPGNSLPLLVTTNGILSAVSSSILTPILNPLITNVNTALLAPLTGLLGVSLGGMDVFVHPTPTCNNPVLAG